MFFSKKENFSISLSFAVIYLVLLLFCGIFADFIAPYPIGEADITKQLCSYSYNHLLGCDTHGSDVLSQLIQGARVSLLVSFAVGRYFPFNSTFFFTRPRGPSFGDINASLLDEWAFLTRVPLHRATFSSSVV